MLDATPGEAHAVLGMMYEPLLPGFSDEKVAAEHYRKTIEAGNVGCGLYLARVYLRQEGVAEIDYKEIRALLEQAEPVNPCGQLYAMLSSCCEQLGDAEAAMKYLKKLHKLPRMMHSAVSLLPEISRWGAGPDWIMNSLCVITRKQLTSVIHTGCSWSD